MRLMFNAISSLDVLSLYVELRDDHLGSKRAASMTSGTDAWQKPTSDAMLFAEKSRFLMSLKSNLGFRWSW